MTTSPQSTSTTVTTTSEPEWAANLSIHPNPSSGQFFIETQDIEIQQISLFDISGKMIFQQFDFNKNIPLSIEQFGTFFLKIQTDKGVVSRKIIRL